MLILLAIRRNIDRLRRLVRLNNQPLSPSGCAISPGKGRPKIEARPKPLSVFHSKKSGIGYIFHALSLSHIQYPSSQTVYESYITQTSPAITKHPTIIQTITMIQLFFKNSRRPTLIPFWRRIVFHRRPAREAEKLCEEHIVSFANHRRNVLAYV